jgi:telomeric repeat-binding factor 2-interacting protein 1
LKHVRGKPRPGGPPREDQQQGTAAEDQSSSERGSQRGDSQQLSAVRNTQSDSIPRTPESSVWRNASSQAENQPSAAEAGPSEATELVRQPARSNLKVIKRKRLSNEDPPAVPKFDTDNNPAKRRRHATEADPSTPGQSNNVSTTEKQTGRGPAPESIRSQSKTTSQYEEETNLAALLELPLAGPALGDEEGDIDEDADEDGDSEGVAAWMEEHIRNGKTGEHLIMALDCTSMNAELADRVLALLSAGHEIPSDIPGVWTKDEDEILLGSETRKIQNLLQKHGSDFYNERFKYLEERQKAQDVVMREED